MRQSTAPAIRTYARLGDVFSALVKLLLNAAFYSCWTELSTRNQVCRPSFGAASYVLTHDRRTAVSIEAADESTPSALEEEAIVHKATEDSILLKRFGCRTSPRFCGMGQEVERLDHPAEGNSLLGVAVAERVHTASKDGVNATVSEEGEASSGGGEEDNEGQVEARTPEVIATRMVRRRRCAIHSIIMVLPEQTGQGRKKAVKEAVWEKRKTKTPKAEKKKKRTKASRGG